MQVKPEHIPILVRRAGIVGAGGAGFPTYVKFERPTKTFIANGTESEPGYFGDKLLMRDHSDSIVKALTMLRDILGYERVVLAIKKKHISYATRLIQASEETEAFEMSYVPDQYMMGEEKTLTKFVTGTPVPKGSIPPHVGVTVDNVETLHNIYWALTEHRPVVYKFLQTIGEVHHDEVIRAPIGTHIQDILRHAGEDPDAVLKRCRLVDGGPLLGDAIEEPAKHVVSRTTNGLFFVDPERFKGRGKHYPGPGHEAPDHISLIADEVDEVAIPLATRYGVPALPVVSVGQSVVMGQEVATFIPDQLSVSAHASIPGTVTKVTDNAIHLRREELPGSDPEA